MATIILIVHLMIALALVGVILLQRSEGGALGIGGGGGGGFLTGRGQANLLTRTTAFLAIGFIATSFVLAILASRGGEPTSILDRGALPPGVGETAPAVPAEPAAPSAPVAE